MVDIYETSAVVAAVGVLVGVVYYVLDMRNQTRMKKTDMLIKLYQSTNNNEFMDAFMRLMSVDVKDYQDYVKQYGDISKTVDNPMNRAFYTTVLFYDMVGVLLFRKLIDLVTVYDVWGTYPIMLFEKVKPIVLGLRREFNEPDFYLGFEYLCAELKRKGKRAGASWTRVTL